MNFEKPKFGGVPREENHQESEDGAHMTLEREEELDLETQKLKGALSKIAEGLQKENVPIDDECRIDIAKFMGVYPAEVITRDQDYIKKVASQIERREHPRVPLVSGEKEKATGERMEMLKTAVFNKFVGKDFVTVRASKYDDIVNKIDNVIIDRKTGATVCAFDEVGETSGRIYEEKKARVLARNHKEHGGTLKYGLRLEKGAKGATRLIKGKVENLPIFYLALSRDHINMAIEEMTLPGEEPSEQEKKLFAYFEASLAAQVKLLEMDRDLNPALAARLKNFEEMLQRLQTSGKE